MVTILIYNRSLTAYFWLSNLFALFIVIFFFFNDTATTEIYTLSLHDALPISEARGCRDHRQDQPARVRLGWHHGDRKSTRLNSSHLVISYAVFCLKKKKEESCETRMD